MKHIVGPTSHLPVMKQILKHQTSPVSYSIFVMKRPHDLTGSCQVFSVMHCPSALGRRLHISRFAASASVVGKQLFHYIAAEHLPLASNCALVSTFNVRLCLVPEPIPAIVLFQQHYLKPEPEESW